MQYLEFLDGAHERLNPPTYLEIGVRHGDSLALARKWAIGVDPKPRLKVEQGDRTRVYRETSDDFFARKRPLRHFDGHRIGLSFIDGLHLAEFALRDFMNVEALARWSSVVVFDDVFPQQPEWAARERETREWTGDVYKVMGVLERHRPDLTLLRVDTEPTGLLLVLGLDPTSTVLSERYAEIEAGITAEQDVPASVLERHGALDPRAVLDASFWDVMRASRGQRLDRDKGVKALRRALRKDFGAASGVSRRALLPF